MNYPFLPEDLALACVALSLVCGVVYHGAGNLLPDCKLCRAVRSLCGQAGLVAFGGLIFKSLTMTI